MSGKNQVMTQEKQELTPSQKFSNYVIKEFTNQVGSAEVSEYERSITQGYFVGIDKALKVAEENRIRKNNNNKDHKWDNNLPITWANVDYPQLAVDVKHYAKMGLDILQSNHLAALPFKSKDGKSYTITFIKGYKGLQYLADKYALDKPKNIVTELVYSNDLFTPIKKSVHSNVESYNFEIQNPFDRGEVQGGFGYIEYEDATKNKLVIMTLKDIEKRKPKNASANFWGGMTTEWRDGKKVEVEADGWYDEMCLKTLKRFVYNSIEIDPEKVDENYRHMQESESKFAELNSYQEIEQSANREVFEIEESQEEVEQVNDDVVEIVEPNEDWQKES